MAMRNTSTSMRVLRPGSRTMVEYNGELDEVIVRSSDKILALRWDAFIEAVERRVQDERYRPLSEEARARGRG